MPDKYLIIVDDDRALVEALAIRARALGIEVATAFDGLTALTLVRQRRPDLLVMDVNMPAGNGLSVCSIIAEDKELDPMPVVMLTGRSDEYTIKWCEHLGAHYVHKSQDCWAKLSPLVHELMELSVDKVQQELAASADGGGNRRPKVLVIDDNLELCKALRIRLESRGVEVFLAFNGMQGFWTALKEKPDVIISDVIMPEGHGNYILGRLRGHSLTRYTPVIIVTGRRIDGNQDFALERELRSLGANAYLNKPVEFDDLVAELEKHIRLEPAASGARPGGVRRPPVHTEPGIRR